MLEIDAEEAEEFMRKMSSNVRAEMRVGAEPVIEGIMKFVRERRRREENRRKDSERDEEQRGEDAKEAEGRRW